MRRLLLSFSAFLALALTVTFPAPSAQAATVLVNLGDLTFTPKDVTISVGDSVRWTSQSDAPHSVTARNGSFDLPGPAPCNGVAFCMSRGQSVTHQFTTPGTFEYYCRVHEAQNMVGTVIVQPAAVTTTRATATTRASATTAAGATTSTARGATTTTTEFLPGGPIDVGDTTSTSTPTGSATAKTKGGGNGSKAVVVIVAALAAISVGGGALLWRLRPRP